MQDHRDSPGRSPPSRSRHDAGRGRVRWPGFRGSRLSGHRGTLDPLLIIRQSLSTYHRNQSDTWPGRGGLALQPHTRLGAACGRRAHRPVSTQLRFLKDTERILVTQAPQGRSHPPGERSDPRPPSPRSSRGGIVETCPVSPTWVSRLCSRNGPARYSLPLPMSLLRAVILDLNTHRQSLATKPEVAQ